MAEETGTIVLAAGRPGQQPQELARIDAAQINAAQADTDATFINGVGKPESTGVNFPIADPYIEEGELLYVGMVSDATDALVSANCSCNITVARKTAAGVSTLRYAIGDRHTTVASGGIADNATLNQGQLTYWLAFPAVPAGAMDKLTGHIQIVTADV